LSNQEQDFIKKRKHLQKTAFAKFIDEDPETIDERDIPVVGLASSGGGYRAMIGLAGYLNAMKQSGALDCVMYFTGISGSCWTMALYYNQLTGADPSRLKRHLQSHVNTHWANMSNFISVLTASPKNSKLLMQGAIQRYSQQKGDISLVDIFGILMGGTLLTKRPVGTKIPENKDEIKEQMRAEDTMEEVNTKKAMHLTGQAEYLEDGSEPMPIYCVVRHDITFGKTLEDRLVELKKIHERSTQEKAELKKLEQKKEEIEREQKDAYQWFEFTPYEMGCEEIEGMYSLGIIFKFQY
jgi:phospholipase A2